MKSAGRCGRGLFAAAGGPKDEGVQIKGEDRSYSLRATLQRSHKFPSLSLFLAGMLFPALSLFLAGRLILFSLLYL